MAFKVILKCSKILQRVVDCNDMSNDDSSDVKCVCDALDEEAIVFYNVIAKTVEVANQPIVA